MPASGSEKKAKMTLKDLPAHLEQQRTHVVCGTERNKHVNTLTAANIFRPLGIDNSWDLTAFKEQFEIKINKLNDECMEFEMIGCDPAIANALRRILIAEIPTVAIEHVFIVNNTSIIQDEVLAHRLGLIPLAIDPAILEDRLPEETANEKNTIIFKLDVTCKRSGDKIINDRVTSGHLQWLPSGSEMPDETGGKFASGQSYMAGLTEPHAVHDDILIAKLRPGQSITLEAHCIRGEGREHAKWSPVATAWYRLYPEVKVIKEEIGDEVIDELIETAPGLFYRHASSGKLCAGIAREHEQHLEKVRLMLDREEISSCVQLLKRKHHFIFTIESTGILPPNTLFLQALEILSRKAQKLADKL
ncbi:hypothetical protein CEUSTIGMA_g3076.t1 [Chlamydomonas eustigma]|uniref:DNA-directed RNA polymerases I and III subunit RPAC1 n=1 Tax=Chlamydomonas eustigma TaxID=1157962 RepID=A0A250WYF2_9CHLO|nr:hypothetical protein CEUSTIGMA_g3076.t1 [Chlamydomonas eustigma]|eukprot:GAX75632.1 hypothetical protein CEUSTIGMA_g3076.t1 [Chlamydomonas eustigma]